METPPVGDIQSPVGNDVARTDLATAQRWSDATRYVEILTRTGKPIPEGRPPSSMKWTGIARVTTTITAATGGTYGSGVITFQKDNGSALIDDSMRAGITVKNFTGNHVASGSTSYISVFWDLGSWWFDGPANCTMLS